MGMVTLAGVQRQVDRYVELAGLPVSGELWTQQETLSQKISWKEIEEDIGHPNLAFTI